MKIMALDLGDQWTGIALSDALHMFAHPHKTVPTRELIPTLQTLLSQEKISTVVVGYPRTLRGTESEQTKKIVASKEQLAAKFTLAEWVLWDERLTSKQAQTLKKARTKEEKLKLHAVAAALILETYLAHLRFKKAR